MKRSKLFAIVLLVLMCASFISCTGEPVETQGTLATDSSASELSTLELTEETSVDSTELENTTKTTETTKTESSAAATEPEITSASSAQSDIPITMAGAVDKPPAYELLQNEAGGYIGVRFTYEDGSTYTWECPVETKLPLFIRQFEAVPQICAIEYCAPFHDWLFDVIDLSSHYIVYRHENKTGCEHVFGTLDWNNNGLYSWYSNGQIQVDLKKQIPIYEEHDASLYVEDFMKTNLFEKIQKIIPLSKTDVLPESLAYKWVFATIPVGWIADKSGAYTGKIKTESGENIILRRTWGHNVLYYSSEPKTVDTYAEVLSLFPFLEEEYSSEDAEIECIETGTGYKAFCLSKMISMDAVTWCNKSTWVLQIDAHYYAKIETYQYATDYSLYGLEVFDTSFIQSLLYFDN